MTLPEILALEPAQVRVMVAEAVGYKFVDLNKDSTRWTWIVRIDDPNGKTVGSYNGEKPKTKTGKRLEEWNEQYLRSLDRSLPDYTGDLNAIAQAVAGMTNEEHRKYRQALISMLPVGPDNEWDRAYVEATALQRARAFLVGKSE